MQKFFHFREYFLLNMNIVVRFMIMSDVIWIGALGFLGPIFSLFIVDYIQGGDARVAGIATTIYLLTKSIFQIPFASIIDRIRGEKDDFWILMIGSVLAALIPLFYLVIHTPMQLYLVQFLYGLMLAATFPSFMAIISRHMDKNKECSEWGIYFTLTDFSSAIAATIGGIMVATTGFHALILLVVGVSLLGTFFLYPLRPFMRLK
ncbi:MAG: MFS transporter [Patescibacteria group bacterium]